MAGTLVVGLGSPHGDDQAGWLVADRLAAERLPHGVIRRARVPLDLIDWLDGIARLVLCDACAAIGTPGQVHRWRWPHSAIARCRSLGSHDFGASNVLELAETLGMLPDEVLIWGIEVGDSSEGGEISPALAEAVGRTAAAIRTELGCFLS